MQMSSTFLLFLPFPKRAELDSRKKLTGMIPRDIGNVLDIVGGGDLEVLRLRMLVVDGWIERKLQLSEAKR